jgi:hypothetical protein
MPEENLRGRYEQRPSVVTLEPRVKQLLRVAYMSCGNQPTYISIRTIDETGSCLWLCFHFIDEQYPRRCKKGRSSGECCLLTTGNHINAPIQPRRASSLQAGLQR